MKNLYLCLIFLVSAFSGIYAQGENNNWYFGRNAGVNFATNPPTAITTSSMVQLEGVASISSPNGSILFYTNGVNVWNKLDQVMPNGSGLLSDNSAAQGVVIVPFPGQTNKFYIFTAYSGPMYVPIAAPYNYSVIDMDLDNGNGDIISGQKNLPLYDETGKNTPLAANSPSYESMTFTQTTNENGYWLLIPRTYAINKLYCYKIDNSGLINNPVVNNLNFGSASMSVQSGSIKVSPDGGYMAISRAIFNQELKIYSFNNSSGTISSIIGTCSNCNANSVEFSIDAKLLFFVSFYNGFNVMDVVTGNIRHMFTSAFGEAVIQRAINNEIYVSKYIAALPPSEGNPNFNTILYKISNATSYANANITTTGQISLGTNRFAQIGLPPIIFPISNNTCLDKRTLSNLIQLSNTTYTAATSITTQNNYVVNSGLTVDLRAGNSVLLKSNTFIQTGASFLAKIEACTVLSKDSNTDFPKSYEKNLPWSINYPEGNETFDLDIYPNPSSDFVNILSEDIISNIVVSTIEGKRVFNSVINETNYQLDVQGYSKGIYILLVETVSGKTATKKLVIQ
ncbi:MAG TPA: T9SS type A sorting domain-containing protein [Flavobacterium sp.]|nr:T9SS type A sorting domain-containing protein [Flavobacterium sp.]